MANYRSGSVAQLELGAGASRGAPTSTLKQLKFKVLFVFCGVGGGALGFQRAQAEFRRLGIAASFEVIGGIEKDESTAKDFTRLTGAKCLVVDVAELTVERLRAEFGDDPPDVICFSPPCKPASGLLSEAIAATDKYRAMAMLGAVWVDLMFATWPRGPKLLVMENVPRITSRAPEMMARIRKACKAHRFHIHEQAHDLGELGGLAQHRDRLLFVGRRDDVPSLLYQPTKKRVRSIGEVLEALPLPGDPRAGRLHRLPAIEAITALRLALIRAGGDWRDLPEKVMLPPELAALVAKGRKRGGPSSRTPFNDVWRVVRFDDPAACVTAGMTPSAGGLSIADPRVGRASEKARNDDHGVLLWDEASGVITGETRPSNGRFSVADPRPTAEGRYGNNWRVERLDMPAHTITGSIDIQNGAPSVADGRVGVDPRVTCKTRENSGIYGVLPYDRPSGTVVGHACHDNGRFSVADPKWPQSVPFPVIISTDGTWHRPLTTLECAVLQGFDPFDADGVAFDLDGPMDACRVKIGDAMPVTATEAMARQMLFTLVDATMGTFSLSPGGGDVWVRDRGLAGMVGHA